MDIVSFWQQVIKVRRAFEEHEVRSVWLTSIENRMREHTGGRVVLVDHLTAAQLLVTGSHHLSTEKEVADHIATQGTERRRIMAEEAHRRAQAVMIATPEQLESLRETMDSVLSVPAATPNMPIPLPTREQPVDAANLGRNAARQKQSA
jgi:hypothetical protein